MKLGLKQHGDDYALQKVPESYKHWSWVSLFGVMLSITTAMFYFAWGGGLVLAYGTKDFFLAMVFGTIIIGSIGYFLVKITSETALDTDLLTISSGFGFRGAGFTSLIYSVIFLMFFALEGTIMSQAVHTQFPHLPLHLLYVFFGLVFIPLTWYGIKLMNYIMWITLPIYITLVIPAIVRASHTGAHIAFWSYTPTHATAPLAGPALLQLISAVMALTVNATVTGDVGRFIPKSQRKIATFMIGYVYEALTFMGAAMLGAWFALKLHQSNPGVYMPALLGIWGMFFVVVTQLRINVLNTYSGSLSFSNFFARAFNFRPGRQWMVFLVAIISTIFMFAGILAHLTQVLNFEAIFILAWIMAVISDILINKRLLKLSPETYAIDKNKVPAFDPVGLTALALALAISLPMVFNALGPLWVTLAPFVSAAIAFVTPPLVAQALIRLKGLPPIVLATSKR
jgi:purine-cytosine permease-like protein